MSPLNGWENFYVIVGSSAGALIGLQFVVMTLIADRRGLSSEEAGAAFATPSVVHFGVALLLSAIASAPWDGMTAPSICWIIVGVCGISYIVVVFRRMSAQTTYRPVFEDWLFHILLPFTAYIILTVSALITFSEARGILFLIAAAALLLLFIGIHNAWDAITYHVLVRRGEADKEEG